jgi:DNA gyrase subunit A
MSTPDNRIVQVNIEEQMKTAYIDYSMSVIVSRALPDVRDGLKPVQRRVIFAMDDLGLRSNKAHKKSARIVGECLGKYHPHGDSSVYEAMVRMAQEWSLRYPLVDGQGNFGSVDGDSAAAMRYTEARLKRIAEDIIDDIEKETVDFKYNFDDTLQEPTVLPSRIPNLLINGASGIAVGMATNMLPHNLGEVVDGIIAYIEDRDISILELSKFIQAPDFPTGGIIYGTDGVKQAFATGRGKVIVRGRAEIETYGKDRERIIVTEIPYQVNKSQMIQRTAQLVNEKKIEGISDIRDESDRTGMRIVYELRREANASVVLNHLYSQTPLQTSYGINNVCLVKGRPRQLNLKQLIEYFVEFRHEIVVRRTKYDLRKAQERAHILEGFLIALDHLDEVIRLIRASANADEAHQQLVTRFGLSDIQTREILQMRLQRLTGLERDKIKAEYAEIQLKIAHLLEILDSEPMRMEIIKNEILEIKQKYNDKRRTDIVQTESSISIEDMIDNEEVVLTISHLGYIKRTSLDEYREQGRGGKGSKGSAARNEDFIEHLFTASTHDYLLVFTEKGKCHWLRVFHIPEGTKTSKGRAIQNIIEIEKDDKVRAYLPLSDFNNKEYLSSHYIVFATQKGIVKKTELEAFSRPRKGGIIAISINEDDRLLAVEVTNGNCEVLVGTLCGKVVRFNETKVRSSGRTSIGVRGVTLNETEHDEVVGLVCIDRDDTETKVLSISQKGYGKRSLLDDFRITNRGGKGVSSMNITEKTGKQITICRVTDNDGLMIINKSGVAIRMSIEKVSVQGRNTQGLRLINLGENDEIASVAIVPRSEVVDVSDDTVIANEVLSIETTEVTQQPDAQNNAPEDDAIVVE